MSTTESYGPFNTLQSLLEVPDDKELLENGDMLGVLERSKERWEASAVPQQPTWPPIIPLHPTRQDNLIMDRVQTAWQKNPLEIPDFYEQSCRNYFGNAKLHRLGLLLLATNLWRNPQAVSEAMTGEDSETPLLEKLQAI